MRIILVLVALSTCLGAGSCGDEESGGGRNAVDEECEIGQDCEEGLYCLYLSPDADGICTAAPAECTETPLSCQDCLQLTDPCPNPNYACSDGIDMDFNVVDNPTVTCN